MTPLPGPEPGRPGDADLLFELRQQIERWMSDKGIDQWEAGSRSRGWYSGSLAGDEWYVVRDGPRLRAAIRLTWRDPGVWRSRDADAVYVHDVMVAREEANAHLGQRGFHLARRDCMEANRKLVSYYAARGYEPVGRGEQPYPHRDGLAWALLMQKSLTPG